MMVATMTEPDALCPTCGRLNISHTLREARACRGPIVLDRPPVEPPRVVAPGRRPARRSSPKPSAASDYRTPRPAQRPRPTRPVEQSVTYGDVTLWKATHVAATLGLSHVEVHRIFHRGWATDYRPPNSVQGSSHYFDRAGLILASIFVSERDGRTGGDGTSMHRFAAIGAARSATTRRPPTSSSPSRSRRSRPIPPGRPWRPSWAATASTWPTSCPPPGSSPPRSPGSPDPTRHAVYLGVRWWGTSNKELPMGTVHRNTQDQFIAKAAAARKTGDLTQAARYSLKARTAPTICDCPSCTATGVPTR